MDRDAYFRLGGAGSLQTKRKENSDVASFKPSCVSRKLRLALPMAIHNQ